MAFKFPFTNYHELNLTWVLDQLKKLFEESAENVSVIENYNDRLTVVETELPTVSETASEASRSASAAATLAQTAKATADTAQENAVQAQSLAGTVRQEAQNAQTAADAATQAAQQAQATAQNFDGRITQAQNDAASALEASRSFENRVQAAITTANNAAQTATNAQGIATRADQNAGAALDKIGDLSALDTTAKQNLVVAINEALENGGKVDSVNGQTGAVVLDAGDIGYNGGTVESALDGKQNAPTALGTSGQVLGLNDSLQPVWVDPTGGGGDTSNCAPLIINSASGDIASFSDGADNMQIRKIAGTIEASSTLANIYNALQANYMTPLNFSSATEYGVTIEYIGAGKYHIYGTSTSDDYHTTIRINGFTIPSGEGRLFELRNLAAPGGAIQFLVDSSVIDTWRMLRTNLSDGGYSAMAGQYTNGFRIWLPVNATVDFTIQPFFTKGRTAPLLINWADEAGVISNGTVTLNDDGSADIVNSDTSESYHIANVGALNTFLGNNNIWIDTGSITECKYPADTKLYIDGKIAELQALALENNG